MATSPTDDGFAVSPAGDIEQQKRRDKFAILLRLQATVNAIRRGSQSSLDEADFKDAYDYLVRKPLKERVAKCFGSSGIAVGGIAVGLSFKFGMPVGAIIFATGAILLATGIYVRDFMGHG
ncbi:MAG TPA: hypothetical protein VHY91_27350 [Pirellulales bacterium]|jgi:hypothetical protein|nr:hypothetical protein [Pirellulales bacterium]